MKLREVSIVLALIMLTFLCAVQNQQLRAANARFDIAIAAGEDALRALQSSTTSLEGCTAQLRRVVER